MLLLSEISRSVTMRGVYYPLATSLLRSRAQLHLLIESNDEMRVRAAVDELRRNLVEASVQALNNTDRAAAAGGRYAV
jgi:ATP-dependent RNA helicase DDX46/PRP5